MNKLGKLLLSLVLCVFCLETSCSDKANAMNIFSTENQAVMKHEMQAVAENDLKKVQISKNSVVKEENVKSKKAFIPKVAHAIKNTFLSVIEMGLLGLSRRHLVSSLGGLRLISKLSDQNLSGMILRGSCIHFVLSFGYLKLVKTYFGAL